MAARDSCEKSVHTHIMGMHGIGTQSGNTRCGWMFRAVVRADTLG